MALLKCPECGHMISEYASACISCGCPMSKIQELLNKKEKTKIPKKEEPKKPKQKLTFKESLSIEELKSLEEIGRYICYKFPLFVSFLTNHFYGLKGKNDNYYSFWFVRNDHNKIMMKSLIEKKAEAKVKIKEVDIITNAEKIAKEIEEQILKWGTEPEKQGKKEEPNKEDDDLLDRQERFINAFSAIILSQYPDFEMSFNTKSTLFKLDETDCNWFYLTIDNKRLLFKYRQEPKYNFITNSFEVDIDKMTPLDLSEFASKLISKSKTEVKTKTNFLDFCDSLVLYMKGKKKRIKVNYLGECEEISEFLKDIANRYNDTPFTLRSKPSSNKYIEKIRYLAFYKYRPMTANDAEMLLYYFIACRIIDVVREYDTKIGGIVIKYSDFLESLINMISKGKVEYARCNGITSKFSFIPESVLDEVLNKYLPA